MEIEEKKYLYSVKPRKPICLPGARPIRVPKSVYLNKSEVRECMKLGSVYRRFANEDNRNEKVTTDNIDRLHNAKFMTEDEYAKYLDREMYGNRGSVIYSNPSPISDNETKEPEKVVTPEKTEVEHKPVTVIVPDASKKEDAEDNSNDVDTEDVSDVEDTTVSEEDNTEEKKETNDNYKNNKNRHKH